MRLKDKIVIITGAGSGIGRATALLMAKEGATVVVADLNLPDAESVVKEIVVGGGKASALLVNVSDHTEMQGLMSKVVAEYGQLDVLVNNAGIGNRHMVKTAEHTVEDWDRVIAVNQSGVFYGMKYALQQMLIQGHGNIVNVASLAGLKASGRNLAYSASKFAVVGMTKSAALEYARKNIRINCVCPGYTHSALLNQVFDSDEKMHDQLLKYIPMNRYGQPEEIAEAIVWLATDKTSFITGQSITLDGGLSL